jgi:hypothetical protein
MPWNSTSGKTEKTVNVAGEIAYLFSVDQRSSPGRTFPNCHHIAGQYVTGVDKSVMRDGPVSIISRRSARSASCQSVLKRACRTAALSSSFLSSTNLVASISRYKCRAVSKSIPTSLP